MSQVEIYHTTVRWQGGHLGHIRMGNGAEMDFSAPAGSHGVADVLTPEDAFVAAVNSCVMLMFLWTCERLKIDLLAYECRAEGVKFIDLDKTETFTRVELFPTIEVDAHGQAHSDVKRRIERALRAAQKYSLVANSIKSEVLIQPAIKIME